MKFIDLFAGIGGVRHGMELAGHECVGWVEWDKFARRSYEAMHSNAKELWNGTDIRAVRAAEIPQADCWCFGFPCQDISVAGKQKGFTDGKRSSLFFTVTGLIRDLEETNRPSYLLIENVKNLLSINRGFDFLKLQIELDEIGYDCEWDVLDSAEVVPQHRERVYIIGHLRGRGTKQVFPIRDDEQTVSAPAPVIKVGSVNPSGYGINGDVVRTDGLASYHYKGEGQKALIQVNDAKHQQDRVYSTDGIAPALNTGTGGNLEPKVLVKSATAKGYQEATAGDGINLSQPNSKTQRGRVQPQRAHTLTVAGSEGVLGNDMRIRKLTPRECWRLQTFPDYLFDRAEKVNSNSQLYKQAGNSVTCEVVHRIAEKMEVAND
ncbi:DNA cytosine methyltransferase [Furfurilactobacillus sp. WILCCON 0119]